MASFTRFKTSGETLEGELTARDAVIGATPASLATSCNVTAPLLRRARLPCLALESIMHASTRHDSATVGAWVFKIRVDPYTQHRSMNPGARSKLGVGGRAGLGREVRGNALAMCLGA